MMEKVWYMSTLDDIDPSLPEGELTIRKIAQYGSRFMSIIAFLLMFPLMILGSIIDQWANNLFSNIMLPLITNTVLKPYRYIFYQVIYWPLKMPLMLFNRQQ
ncbi:MAG: hypothetical protein WBV73_12720 [Phormidium sp.]